MRRDLVPMVGSLALCGLALWLVLALTIETARVLLGPIAPFVVWLFP